MKYFFHGFFKGTYPNGVVRDIVGCYPIDSWEILPTGIMTHTPTDHPRGYKAFNSFGPGNRFYIVANNGQCQEPNGDIIWRNEDGAFGDEEAA